MSDETKDREPMAWSVEEETPDAGWVVDMVFTRRRLAQGHERHLIEMVGLPREHVRIRPLYSHPEPAGDKGTVE